MNAKTQKGYQNDKENQPSNQAAAAAPSSLTNVASLVQSREDLNKTYSVLEGRRNTGAALQRSLKGKYMEAT